MRKKTNKNLMVTVTLCIVRVLQRVSFSEKELFPHLTVMRNPCCSIFPLLGEKWLLLLKSSIQTHFSIQAQPSGHVFLCLSWAAQC